MIRTEPFEARRTALVAALGPQPSASVSELWYLLHGQGMRAEQILEMAKSLDDGTRVLIAPEALNRHYTGPIVMKDAPVGATWMTRDRREWDIEDNVRYLDALHERTRGQFGGPTPPVTILGFSQGGAAAVRWCAYGTIRPARLIVWASSLPPDVDYRALVAKHPRVALTYVNGTRDKFITPKVLEAQHALLRENGVPFSPVEFAGGHRLDENTLKSLSDSSGTSGSSATVR